MSALHGPSLSSHAKIHQTPALLQLECGSYLSSIFWPGIFMRLCQSALTLMHGLPFSWLLRHTPVHNATWKHYQITSNAHAEVLHDLMVLYTSHQEDCIAQSSLSIG